MGSSLLSAQIDPRSLSRNSTSSTRTQRPVAISKKRIVLSREAEMTRSPLGSKHTPVTLCSWPEQWRELAVKWKGNGKKAVALVSWVRGVFLRFSV